MPSPISLVVTDLDGTLWHTDDAIDPTVVVAAGEVTRRGVPLLVATGRRRESTARPLASVGLTPPAVVLNGALGLDLATGERFHRAPFAADQALAVLAAFRSAGCDPVLYLDHPEHDTALSADPSTHAEHAAALGGAPVDLDEVAATVPVLGFSMIGRPPEECAAARDAVGDLAETHLDRSLDYEGMSSFTVAPRGQSKWDGVLAFCARHGLDPTTVLALADGPNDLELLDNAAVSLVPEVAHPEALARADHVIPAAAVGGWTAVLDHI